MNRIFSKKYGHAGERTSVVPKGAVILDAPLPKTHQYSYSNPKSQGALICETPGFPAFFDRVSEEHHSAYSDRIILWDHDRFNKACEIAGGGDQAWSYILPSLSADKLREFARVALNLPRLPKHCRVIHYFNVTSGYSCPVVEAICQKKEVAE